MRILKVQNRMQKILSKYFSFKRFSKKNKSSKDNYSDFYIFEENKVTVEQTIFNNDDSSNIYQSGRDIILNGEKVFKGKKINS